MNAAIKRFDPRCGLLPLPGGLGVNRGPLGRPANVGPQFRPQEGADQRGAAGSLMSSDRRGSSDPDSAPSRFEARRTAGWCLSGAFKVSGTTPHGALGM